MLTLQRCRELLETDSPGLSDSELEALRKQLYAIAQVGIHARARERQFAQAIAALAEDERADVEERAAILEFDGKLSRDQAERLALSPYSRRPPKA